MPSGRDTSSLSPPWSIGIDDPEDPRLSPYRSMRERDLVGRDGRFIAEGKVVLDMLLRSTRFSAESVLVLRSKLPGLAATLAHVPASTPIYAVEPALMDAIAGFHLHRGVLAVGVKPPLPGIAELLETCPADALVVAAAGIANHDNVGAIFRNAAAFGAHAVVLDETCCDPLYRKSIRVSVGSVLTLPYARSGSAPAMVDALQMGGFSVVALSPRGAADLWDVPRSGRVALLLGTEGEGLPETLLSRLKTVRIPMHTGLDSLNVATTAAVALYELTRGGR